MNIDQDLPIRRPRQSLSDKASQALSRMIYEGQLRAGETLVEESIAAYLGLSRTPLRQAMQSLESEGLLDKRDGRSYQVRTVDLKEYLQSLKVREILEPEAAALAVGRISQDEIDGARRVTRELAQLVPYDKIAHWRADALVHNLFIDNCGNDVMKKTLKSLRVTTQLFEAERLSDRLGPDSREHMQIMDALEAGDAKAARLEVVGHIRSLIDFAVRTIS